MKKSLLKLAFTFATLIFTFNGYAQVYTFTPCGATGQNGPIQGQVNTAYTSTTLQGAVTINTQGVQEWTVPVTGNYSILTTGAKGGDIPGFTAGLGASMYGEFLLTQGTVLKIVVGQEALDGTLAQSYCATGGGGGSFVTDNANSPLIIAGGGGGRRNLGGVTSPLADGIITAAGQNSCGGGTGGTAGNGGSSIEPTGNGTGGPGAGLLTNGGPCGTCSATSIGMAFVNGAMGGDANATIPQRATEGGFGGGGGGCWCYRGTAGGGGGYSGGGTGSNDACGGGGGSFNSGTNTVDSTGANSGDGQVIITSLCNGGPGAALPAFTQDSVCLNDPTITIPAGTPAGGTYYGNGVSGNTFIPSLAGVGTHYVVYSYADSCSVISLDSTMIVVQPCAVGIDENASLNGVKIFPNPTNGLVTIDLGNHKGTVNYSISTIEGRIVNSKNNVITSNINIDLTNEGNGVYILKLEDATSSKTYKLLKE